MAVKTKKKRKKNNYPTKIECIVCHSKKGITQDRWPKLLNRFDNDLKKVQEYYVCRVCRKKANLDKKGEPKPIRRKRVSKSPSQIHYGPWRIGIIVEDEALIFCTGMAGGVPIEFLAVASHVYDFRYKLTLKSPDEEEIINDSYFHNAPLYNFATFRDRVREIFKEKKERQQ